MEIITNIQQMHEWAQAAKEQGQSIGLVPTMGYLHPGHLSLMRAARAENDLVAASIFVNPTQFGPHEDFARYPRDLQADSALTQGVGVDALFCPTVEAMYPPGYSCYVEPEGLSKVLCGASRPGHFRGVCTVVLKLFQIVLPQRAYFGQKDAQQFLILQRMVRDFHLDVAMVRLPIVREADGLALSSRNVYLTREQREQAPTLRRALARAEALYAAGEREAAVLRAALLTELARAPLGNVEYAEIVDLENLQPLTRLEQPALLALAVRFGATRLIDNTILG